MGSRCKKALVAESVRESLHSWCKRVKEKSKRDALRSYTVRSTCSLDTTIDERDEITVASGTLSRSSSLASLNNQDTVTSIDQIETVLDISDRPQKEFLFRMEEFLSESLRMSTPHSRHGEEDNVGEVGEEGKDETLSELFRRT